MLPWDCFFSPSSASSSLFQISYHIVMQLSTLIPLIIMILIVLVYMVYYEIIYIRSEVRENDVMNVDDVIPLTPRRQRQRYHQMVIVAEIKRKKEQRALLIRGFTLLSMLYYLSLGGVCSLILGSFACVDLDPNDIVPGNQRVLWNDVTVDCDGDMYNDAIAWAAITFVVYLVIFPVSYNITIVLSNIFVY